MVDMVHCDYKIMKHLQRADTAQDHFETFTLRHNLRVFERGKRAGKNLLQLEGIETNGTDWTDLIWGEKSEELLKEIEVSALKRCSNGQQNKTKVVQNNYALAKN